MKNMDSLMEAINKIANEALNENVRYKGTGTYYYKGHIGNKSVCYTRAKTSYKNRWGFWSWIQTKYKNGKTKRTRFAKSGSKAKSEARAERLLKQLKQE